MKAQMGRPEQTATEKKFKQNSKKHELRILLECKVLQKYFSAWMLQQPYTVQIEIPIRETFKIFGEERHFTLLQELFAVTNITVNSTDIMNYTCKKDILYVLHKLKEGLDSRTDELERQVKVVSARLLYLLIMYYLFQQKVLNRLAFRWMNAHYQDYAEVMRKGRDPNPQNPEDYALVELLVRWALEMAKLQKLLIYFD